MSGNVAVRKCVRNKRLKVIIPVLIIAFLVISVTLFLNYQMISISDGNGINGENGVIPDDGEPGIDGGPTELSDNNADMSIIDKSNGGCTTTIAGTFNEHTNVITLRDTNRGGISAIQANLYSSVKATIKFSILFSDVQKGFSIRLYGKSTLFGDNAQGIILSFGLHSKIEGGAILSSISYYDTIEHIAGYYRAREWVDVEISYDTDSDTWSLYLNGDKITETTFINRGNWIIFNRMYMQTSEVRDNYNVYMDLTEFNTIK
jgi:hypothetical protein